MNSLLKKLFFLLCLFAPILNAQYLINNYDGIPIIASVPWDVLDYHLDSAKAMGADFIIATQLTETRLTEIKNRGLKVIPLQTDPLLYNYIYKYSDGAYTKWEAEGTPVGKGDAKLKYKTNICSTFTTGSRQGVVTNIGAGYDTLIYGPGYMQERRYWRIDTGYVNYNAEFNLMLSNIIPEEGSPNDTICILQITDSKIVGPPSEPSYRDSIVFIKEIALIRSYFTPGIWQTVGLIYNFHNEESDVQQPANQLFNYTYQNYQSSEPTNKNLADFVQFKIIWKGDPHSRLYVDNIIVSDLKGKEIVMLPIAKQNIITQATQSFNSGDLENYVAAWFTIDEPETIDNYEPMRVIDSLLKVSSNGKRGLWVSFPSSWNGRYGDSYLGTHGLYKSNEFLQRTGITPHQNNHPLFDAPYRPPEQDYRIKNIKVLGDTIMNRVNDWDPNFSMTLLCGKVEEARLFHDPLPHEMLYEANLKLMYGAKSLSLYRYFGGDNDPTFTGLVNYTDTGYTYTDKYYMVRNILAPRLKAVFGKTLKLINQTEQHLNIDASSYYNFIDHFSGNLECLPTTSDYDLGFFTDSLSRDYFMLISRYYNNGGACPIFINLDEGCLYNNLVLTKFVADTTYNILRSDPIPVNLTRGDAELYRIYPVVRWGGSLLSNDTTNSGETLHSDMIVENNATLVINGTYYANADITVKAGGKIKYGSNNSKIVFSSGKKLIVQGLAEIKGTSSANKLALQFSGNNTAVLVKPGSSLTIDYCNITGAYQGIVTETGARSYVNISNSNISATCCGISLASGTSSEDITSQIYKCNFTSTLYGISASNYNLILIQENTLTGCGINISNSSSAFLQGNVITGSGSATTFGIFMSSSTGYVRCNIISNCLNGLHLANSSPDCGGNILQGNIRHGMYIGSGSIPNLVGHLQINPPLYFSLSGFNKIYSNGSATSTNPVDNDGSEIYLASSNILLNNGCNQISDDRLSTPSMNTQYLISGSLNSGKTLSAFYNYWGTRTIAANRFKSLTVTYSPYYTENCPLPDGGSGSGGSETLVLRTSTGLVVDTLIAAEGVPENYSTLQVVYSEADNLFATGNVTQAKPLYEQIVTGNYTSEEKLSAYNKLYAIGNLTGEDENYFTGLQNTFDEIANTETDTLIKKVYQQNAIKCDVSKQEYLTAISKFDNIIQQNPNSEEAVYAEIDIITTALNIDTTNPGLGKLGGKYLVKSTSDYLSKLNDILQSKFGVNSEEGKQIIPKEYSLHQNYPNPFNPTTTIKFDIPDVGPGLAQSNVTLKVYDILGKEIATLVNEDKSAGVYEISFDASTLASGVYIYKLQAGDFVNSKKMILLK